MVLILARVVSKVGTLRRSAKHKIRAFAAIFAANLEALNVLLDFLVC